jgi:hypothetical protein
VGGAPVWGGIWIILSVDQIVRDQERLRATNAIGLHTCVVDQLAVPNVRVA